MKIKYMRPLNGDSKTKAFFSVEWEGKMTVNDCKLVEGRNGLFAAMPSRQYDDKKSGDKKYQSIVYLEQDLLLKVSDAALEEYNRLTGKGDSTPQDDSDIPF
jgi:stage V sporulation protein G